MTAPLKSAMRWARSPAKNVDSTSGSWVNMIRGLAARATTPLLPDDYLSLLNPLWSARELRGEIVGGQTRDRRHRNGHHPAGLGVFRRLPTGPVRRDRPARRRQVALAVVFADVGSRTRRREHLDHREGHPRGLLVGPPGQWRRTGHHHPPAVGQRRLRTAEPTPGSNSVHHGRQWHHTRSWRCCDRCGRVVSPRTSSTCIRPGRRTR